MGTKLKVCEHCERPRSEHKTRKGEKGRNGEADRPRWPLACPVGAPNSFKLAKPIPDPEQARRPMTPTPRMRYRGWPLEMVDGKWQRKINCPCCGRHLPPFFSTAGLRENQGHVQDVDCICGSKIHKPDGWKWGEPLDVKFNAVAAQAEAKRKAAMAAMKGKKDENDQSANPSSV